MMMIQVMRRRRRAERAECIKCCSFLLYTPYFQADAVE
jgi:hypothetical protein